MPHHYYLSSNKAKLVEEQKIRGGSVTLCGAWRWLTHTRYILFCVKVMGSWLPEYYFHNFRDVIYQKVFNNISS